MKYKHTTLALMLAAAGLATGAAHAQEKVTIGFITDMSSLYSDVEGKGGATAIQMACLLYTSDAADDLLCVDLGGRRIIKKKNTTHRQYMTYLPY